MLEPNKINERKCEVKIVAKLIIFVKYTYIFFFHYLFIFWGFVCEVKPYLRWIASN